MRKLWEKLEKEGHTWPPGLQRAEAKSTAGPTPPAAKAAPSAPSAKAAGSLKALCETEEEVDPSFDIAVAPLCSDASFPNVPVLDDVPDAAGRAMSSCPSRPASSQ